MVQASHSSVIVDAKLFSDHLRRQMLSEPTELSGEWRERRPTSRSSSRVAVDHNATRTSYLSPANGTRQRGIPRVLGHRPRHGRAEQEGQGSQHMGLTRGGKGALSKLRQCDQSCLKRTKIGGSGEMEGLCMDVIEASRALQLSCLDARDMMTVKNTL